VDFRLKAWADRYLVLRTDLCGDDQPDEGAQNQKGAALKGNTNLFSIGASKARNGASLKDTTDLCSIGAFGSPNAPILEPVSGAVFRVLRRIQRLRYQPPRPALSYQERNRIIHARYEAGESQADIARDLGISYQRIHQIIQDNTP
jgi:Sigma-70, region 4